jgi:hypothetical protein
MEFEVPDGPTQRFDYEIMFVSEDLPEGLYTLVVDKEELRAVKNTDGWIVTGRL